MHINKSDFFNMVRISCRYNREPITGYIEGDIFYMQKKHQQCPPANLEIRFQLLGQKIIIAIKKKKKREREKKKKVQSTQLHT